MSETRTIPYNASLDGLRAVAVLAVMLYHGGVWWASGGFLGVDVFFVLSGYLITTLLYAEHHRDGSIDLKAFWGRRARRLLPAVGAFIVAVAFYAAYTADPSQRGEIQGDALATLAYVANWRFVFEQTSYFDQFLEPSPLRHMWSLGIEEQWYVLWPLLFSAAIAWLGRARQWRFTAMVAFAALASAVWMFVLFDPAVDPSRVYYGTDTRLQGLLVGAALALALAGRPRHATVPARRAQIRSWLSAGAGLVGLVGLGVMFHRVGDDQSWMYRGGFLLAALVAAAVVYSLATSGENGRPPGPAARLLALPPLPAIGRISYGLYLWHWLIYVFLNEERVGFGGDALFWLRVATTFAVAILSYRLLELPIRQGALTRLRPGALAAATGLGLAVVLVLATVPAEQDAEASGPQGTGATDVLLVGDSVANSLANNFDPASAPELTVASAAIPGCGLLRGRAVDENGRLGPENAACEAWPQRWTDAVNRINPDVSVVVFAGWGAVDRKVGDRVVAYGSDEYVELYREALDELVETLAATGGDVVVGLPACTDPNTDALSLDNFGGGTASVTTDASERQAWARERFVELEARREIRLVDLGELGCPEGQYREEVDDTELRPDGVHYGPEGADVVWRWLSERL